MTRYQAQQGLIRSDCTIEDYLTSNFESCPCKDTDLECTGHGTDYSCMQISIRAYDAETKEIITNDAHLFQSDWEYVLYKRSREKLDALEVNDDDAIAVSKVLKIIV